MANEERSLGELLGAVTNDLSTLVRDEIALAKAEIQQTISQAVKDIVFIVVGGFFAYTGLLALIAAAILGLANVIAPWLSALIIGGVIVLIGVVLLLRGINNISNLDVVPERTAQTVKEDVNIVREKL